MSNRQVQGYLNRLKNNDPNKNYFLEFILPALKGTKSRQGVSYECPVCVDKLNGNCSLETKLFTTYYTFIRHLSEQHKDNLPCNGLIFSGTGDQAIGKEKKFKCHICNMQFGRKEHLNKHKLSLRHRDAANKQNQDIDNNNNNNKNLEDLESENEENSSEIIFVSEEEEQEEENKCPSDSSQVRLYSTKRSRSDSSVSDCDQSKAKKSKFIDGTIRDYLVEIETDHSNSRKVSNMLNEKGDKKDKREASTEKSTISDNLLVIVNLDDNILSSIDLEKSTDVSVSTKECDIKFDCLSEKKNKNLNMYKDSNPNIANDDERSNLKANDASEADEEEEDDRQLLKLFDIYKF